MAPFVVRERTPLPPEVAWRRLVDWSAHGRFVPLTRIRVNGTGGVGTVFVARTGLGRLGFDDPMEVVAWDPPRHARIEKRGRVVRGWAELTVTPDGDGALVTWTEEATPRGLPGPVAERLGRRLFRRVVRGLLRG